jgi:hypothetical protein
MKKLSIILLSLILMGCCEKPPSLRNLQKHTPQNYTLLDIEKIMGPGWEDFYQVNKDMVCPNCFYSFHILIRKGHLLKDEIQKLRCPNCDINLNGGV